MCIRFAELERKLGEIDRARAVYMHASQMSDPRVSSTHLIICSIVLFVISLDRLFDRSNACLLHMNDSMICCLAN